MKNIWEHAIEYSALASNTARQMNFAGIAIIWTAASGMGKGSILLSIALFMFAMSLFLELFQFLALTIYHNFRAREAEMLGDEEYLSAQWVIHITDALFGLKILATLVGYAVVLWFLFKAIS